MSVDPAAKIYVAGHSGLAGSALVRRLHSLGYANLLTPTHAQVDLEDDRATRRLLLEHRPEVVFLAAGHVGGIAVNNAFPVDFLLRNLKIAANVIESSYAAGVRRLIYLGSSCIYPRDCPQPIREEYLLSGPLEATNRAYALAKIAGVEMCWAYNRQFRTGYLAVAPTNLYGPGDHYDLESSHVLPALIRKIHEAKQANGREVVIWGSGTPKRELLHADDLARALVFLAQLDDARYMQLTNAANCPLINVGSGADQTIRELAEAIGAVVGFRGQFVYDRSKPDGTPRKTLDVSRILALGWRPQVDLRSGLAQTYADYQLRAARG